MSFSNLKKNCTLLVNSCDINEDLWNPFFQIFLDCWGEHEIPSIVLNTETKEYSYGRADIITIKTSPSENKNWGGRMKAHLKKIKTPLVIFTLDDYFPVEPINVEEISKMADILMRENEVDMIYFSKGSKENSLTYDRHPEYTYISGKAPYKLSAQASIWKRERLIQIIKNHENPWQFERYGSIRAWRLKTLYLCQAKEKQIYSYDPNGYGLVKGKWALKTPDLFKKYGISIDYSIRGFSNLEDDYKTGRLYSLRMNFPQKVLTPRFQKELWGRIICYIRSVF